jgi:hypothetical protein
MCISTKISTHTRAYLPVLADRCPEQIRLFPKLVVRVSKLAIHPPIASLTEEKLAELGALKESILVLLVQYHGY